jgi:hypothetical protein
MKKSTIKRQREFNKLSRKAYKVAKRSLLNKCENVYYKGLKAINKSLRKVLG